MALRLVFPLWPQFVNITDFKKEKAYTVCRKDMKKTFHNECCYRSGQNSHSAIGGLALRLQIGEYLTTVMYEKYV